MDIKRKRQLLEVYRNRKPEMGVISIRCKATGDAFLDISKDTKANLNSIRCRLSTSWVSNKELQELWDQYGESEFEFSVAKILKYDDPQVDHTDELEKLLEQCLSENNQARRL